MGQGAGGERVLAHTTPCKGLDTLGLDHNSLCFNLERAKERGTLRSVKKRYSSSLLSASRRLQKKDIFPMTRGGNK